MSTYAASKGAKVYLMCRNSERAEAAKNDIMKKTMNDQIHVLLVRTYIYTTQSMFDIYYHFKKKYWNIQLIIFK